MQNHGKSSVPMPEHSCTSKSLLVSCRRFLRLFAKCADTDTAMAEQTTFARSAFGAMSVRLRAAATAKAIPEAWARKVAVRITGSRGRRVYDSCRARKADGPSFAAVIDAGHDWATVVKSREAANLTGRSGVCAWDARASYNIVGFAQRGTDVPGSSVDHDFVLTASDRGVSVVRSERVRLLQRPRRV